jgi:[acyl-carrier-protein] S-malonyltransferase
MAANGAKLFCEVGTGKVLTGLLKKNAPEAQGLALGTPDDIAAAAAILKQG